MRENKKDFGSQSGVIAKYMPMGKTLSAKDSQLADITASDDASSRQWCRES